MHAIFSFKGHTLREIFGKMTNGNKYKNKRVRLFMHETMSRKLFIKDKKSLNRYKSGDVRTSVSALV